MEEAAKIAREHSEELCLSDPGSLCEQCMTADSIAKHIIRAAAEKEVVTK